MRMQALSIRPTASIVWAQFTVSGIVLDCELSEVSMHSIAQVFCTSKRGLTVEVCLFKKFPKNVNLYHENMPLPVLPLSK